MYKHSYVIKICHILKKPIQKPFSTTKSNKFKEINLIFMLDDSSSMKDIQQDPIQDQVAKSINQSIDYLSNYKNKNQQLESKKTNQLLGDKSSQNITQKPINNKQMLVPQKVNIFNDKDDTGIKDMAVSFVSSMVSIFVESKLSKNNKELMKRTKSNKFDYALSCIRSYLDKLSETQISNKINVNFVTFNMSSQIRFNNLNLNRNKTNLDYQMMMSCHGGGTNFSEPFKDAISLLHTNNDTFNLLYFYTDGEGNQPNQEVRQLAKFHNFKLQLFVEMMDKEMVDKFKKDLGSRVEVKIISLNEFDDNLDTTQLLQQVDSGTKKLN